MKGYIHKVQYYETDRMGVTHHSNYIRWMEEARVEFLDRMGWGYERLEAMGIVSPVIKASCEYKKTTTFADEIEISARIKEYKGIRLIMSYEMRRADTGEVVALGESGHCFLDEGGSPLLIKRRFPEFDAVLARQREADEERE